jgi:hypothetical protein
MHYLLPGTERSAFIDGQLDWNKVKFHLAGDA